MRAAPATVYSADTFRTTRADVQTGAGRNLYAKTGAACRATARGCSG
ncbi:hypothetical protein [Nocardia inohanensis]|nr:hypothetical protein [Nocardia inohanensis]